MRSSCNATVRALKMQCGRSKKELGTEDLKALEAGIPTCRSTSRTFRSSACPWWWRSTASRWTPRSLPWWRRSARSWAPPSRCLRFGKGRRGRQELAQKVAEACEKPCTSKFIYDAKMSPKEMEPPRVRLRRRAWTSAPCVEKDLQVIHGVGQDDLLVCMAKTQYSSRTTRRRWASQRASASRRARCALRWSRVPGGGHGEIMTMPGLRSPRRSPSTWTSTERSRACSDPAFEAETAHRRCESCGPEGTSGPQRYLR